MARVNVRCWQETYRGLMSDAVLDDPGFPDARQRLSRRPEPSLVQVVVRKLARRGSPVVALLALVALHAHRFYQRELRGVLTMMQPPGTGIMRKLRSSS
jgi:hypothetical protein